MVCFNLGVANIMNNQSNGIPGNFGDKRLLNTMLAFQMNDFLGIGYYSNNYM